MQTKYKYILAVYEKGPLSDRVEKKVRDFFERHDIPYDLAVIDLAEKPEEAVKRNIFAIPTLIREFPLPERRFFGDFSAITLEDIWPD